MFHTQEMILIFSREELSLKTMIGKTMIGNIIRYTERRNFQDSRFGMNI